MAALSTEERNNLPDSDFALIQTRKGKDGKEKKVRRFPINDKNHADLALKFLSRAKDITPAEREQVRERAYKKLYGTTNRAAIAKIKKKTP